MHDTPRSEAWRSFALPGHEALARATGDDFARWRIDTEACAATATQLATAYLLSYVSRYDWWFLAYAYRVDGRQYVFAWETPYDELHRGYGGGPATWYDGVGQGAPFAVRIDPADPLRHVIIDEPFAQMNGVVCVLDPGN